METTFHCAYNLTRRFVLSERVVMVSGVQSPAQLVALVLHGPGRDSVSSVWLTQPDNAVDMPRLFAFEVAYLDDQQTIVDVGAVGPATPFPTLANRAATILFLPDQCLARSETVPGDRLKICTASELPDLLKDSSPSERVETPQQSVRSFTSTENVDASPVQIYPRFTELFSASLIYLPSSGLPQRSEFFLPSEPPRGLEPGGSTRLEAQPAATDSEAPEALEHEPLIAQNSASEYDEDRRVAEPPSLPTQLPPSLRAVLHSVDEQIRREGKGHENWVPPANDIDGEESKPTELSRPEKLEVPATPAGQQKPSARSPRPPAPPARRPIQEVSQLADASEVEASRQAFPLRQPGSEASPSQSPTALHPSASARPSVNSVPTEPEPSGQIRSTPKPEERKPPASAPPSTDVEPSAIPGAKEKLSLGARVQRWLSGESSSLSGNRRRGDRFSVPGLVAFYWTGGAPTPHEIVNISTSGLYLRSRELWSPDTLVRMTLERQDAEWERPDSISVLARVVRRDDGGVGHEFIMTEVLENLRVRDFLPEHGTNRKELEKFLSLH